MTAIEVVEQVTQEAKQKAFDIHNDMKDAILKEWALPTAQRHCGSILKEDYKFYMTLGASITSLERSKECGNFIIGTRDNNLNNPGSKRDIMSFIGGASIKGEPLEPKDRLTRLFDSFPAVVQLVTGGKCLDENNQIILSKARQPDWQDNDDVMENEADREQAEIELANDPS
jgi:hypothetical protein